MLSSFCTPIFIIFYSYAWSIYKRQRTGEREILKKYSKLVHDDSSVSSFEERKNDKDIDNKEK